VVKDCVIVLGGTDSLDVKVDVELEVGGASVLDGGGVSVPEFSGDVMLEVCGIGEVVVSI